MSGRILNICGKIRMTEEKKLSLILVAIGLFSWLIIGLKLSIVLAFGLGGFLVIKVSKGL